MNIALISTDPAETEQNLQGQTDLRKYKPMGASKTNNTRNDEPYRPSISQRQHIREYKKIHKHESLFPGQSRKYTKPSTTKGNKESEETKATTRAQKTGPPTRLTPQKTTNTNSNNKTSNTDTARRFMLAMLIIGRLLGQHYEPVNNKTFTNKELEWTRNQTKI